MKLLQDKKILIIGLGLMGGSYARKLTQEGFYVGAIDTNFKSIRYALDNHIIKEGNVEVDKEFIDKYDIVVFSLYPKTFIKWIEEYGHIFKKGTIITDVTGVKGSVIPDVNKGLTKDVEYIAAHPMAGREVYGVENSKADLFNDANYIITPTKDNTEYAVNLSKELGEVLGFRHVSCLTPEQHDEMIAFTSQLTHCIAVSLMTCKESHHLVDYTGDSFRDLTRIANINEFMWSELFLMNKEKLLAEIDCFVKELTKLRNAIDTEDVDLIKSLMKESTKRRSYFNKKED